MHFDGKRRLASAFGLLCCLNGSGAFGAASTRGGPIDITLEPLLVGATAVYKGPDGLYSIQGGSRDASRIGPPFPTPRIPILSAQMVLQSGIPAVAWIEKLPQGNRLLAVTAAPNGRYPAEIEPLADQTSANTVALEPFGDRMILLDAATGTNPALFVTQFPPSGGHPAREAVPVSSLEQLYSLATLPAAPVLHILLHGRSNGRDVIGMIDYDPARRTTGNFEVVAETPVTPLVQAFAVRGSPAVLFKVYQNDRFSLKLAVREAGGWRIATVPPADGLDVARLDQHVWPDGRILLAYSAEQREKSKQRVYAAVSDDIGAHWQTRQLDSAEFSNTRAWLPRLAVAGDRVAVVWEDARDIRSRIRMQLSMDRGNGWLARDFPLSPAKSHAIRPRIANHRDQLVVAWQQYRSDARIQADLILQTLTWAEAKARTLEKAPAAQDQRRRLEAAVNAYWKAMATNDHRRAYLAHDPFYRAKVSYARHAAHTGTLIYRRHSVKDIAIQGNEALVTVVVNISVPPPPGAVTKRDIPSLDHAMLDTWLYIDGRWYRKFVDSASGGSAINY